MLSCVRTDMATITTSIFPAFREQGGGIPFLTRVHVKWILSIPHTISASLKEGRNFLSYCEIGDKLMSTDTYPMQCVCLMENNL